MKDVGRTVSQCLCFALLALPVGCVGAVDGTDSPSSDDPFGDDGNSGGGSIASLPAATPSGIRRLTPDELDSTIQDLLGGAARPNSATLLPQKIDKDKNNPFTFDNEYRTQVSSEALVEGLDLLVKEQVAGLLANPSRRDAVVGCAPASEAEWPACMRTFLTKFGRKALRRPLSVREIERGMKFLDLAKKDLNFHTGVELAMRALLQHPELLYRVETGTPAAEIGVFRLGSFEVATRLSYLLWGTTPDDGLLDRAERGQLDTPAQVRQVAQVMMADARARRPLTRFHAMWLGFGDMELAEAQRAEAEALVSRVIQERKLPWSALLSSEETFVTYELATVYGMRPPSTLKPGGRPQWLRYPTADRRGILSHSAFLAVGAEDQFLSPITRGKNVRVNLLCEPIGLPADTNGGGTSNSPCKAEQLKAKTQTGGCAGCHDRINPIGFGLLNYEASGKYREFEPDENTGKDNPSCPIKGEGMVSGLGTDGTFKGPAALGALLIRSGRFVECGSAQLYRFATGRKDLDDDDHRLVRFMLGTGSLDGVRLDEALLRLVTAKAFFHRREEKTGG
jgi:hypothetical protein